MSDHPNPKGPEDPTPGCTVRLTKAQLARVQEISEGTVELEDRGAAWVAVRVFDADGNMVEDVAIAPV